MEQNQKNPLVEDVEFILQECIRFKKIIEVSKLQELTNEDFLITIHGPDQKSHICGRLASMRLDELTEKVSKRGGVLNRVEHAAVRKLLGELIFQRFVIELRPINTQQIDRMCSSVIKEAKHKCTKITHYLPCHLMSATDPETIHLGPVRFHNKSSFRRLLIKNLKKSRTNKKSEDNRYTRKLMSEAIRYFRHFQWFAEVTIPSADEKTSGVLAEQAVTSALDCLHLLLSAEFTDRMRVAGPAIRRDKRGKLTLKGSDQLFPSTSWSSIQQVNYPEGWSSQLQEPDVAHFLSLFGVALELAVDPNLERPLSRRFLDAAQWFGEASRDASPSTKIVKYITCLERMVMTDEHDDISLNLSERVAHFCADELEGCEVWKKRALDIYDLRSKLVHGSMSPKALEINRFLFISATVGERTLLNCLFSFGREGLELKQISSRKLGKWFKSLAVKADHV
jgi:hypothetical protein